VGILAPPSHIPLPFSFFVFVFVSADCSSSKDCRRRGSGDCFVGDDVEEFRVLFFFCWSWNLIVILESLDIFKDRRFIFSSVQVLGEKYVVL
jgi:hypothetical protein